MYTSSYAPKEGVFVYEGGFTCPRNDATKLGYPWPFHFYPMPKIQVSYIGEFDVKTPVAMEMQEIEQEMQPDIGKYRGLAQDLEGFEVPAVISRYEVRDD